MCIYAYLSIYMKGFSLVRNSEVRDSDCGIRPMAQDDWTGAGQLLYRQHTLQPEYVCIHCSACVYVTSANNGVTCSTTK